MKPEQIITDFSYARKEHWRSGKLHGAKTACQRKTSGVGTNETESFEFWATKHPEVCCSKCLARYNEYTERRSK